jgi:hypothetical protein
MVIVQNIIESFAIAAPGESVSTLPQLAIAMAMAGG